MTGDASGATRESRRLWGSDEFRSLLEELGVHASALEEPGATAEGQLDRMAAAGVMRWGIPSEFGGSELSAAEQIEGMSLLASACLVSTFVLSQRNAAVSRVVASENEFLKKNLLPRMARHEVMATVGISHLTTSRQHLDRPAVAAVPDGDGYLLDGVIPWVTAGSICDFILAGGTLPDGRQLLALVSTEDPGVGIEPPPEMLALNASQTGAVSLTKVRVGRDLIAAGPVEGVMKGAAGGTGSVTTSALALGLAAGVSRLLGGEAARRPDLKEIDLSFARECEDIWGDLRSLLDGGVPARPGVTSESVRARANGVALRVSQAYLAASKGAGFVKGHPAERAVREAMFFLVWSCPQPVVQAALRSFACLAE